MTDKPTPESDALFYSNGWPCDVDEQDARQLCEQLEQQRDEARQLAEMYRNICFDWKWPKPEPFAWEKSTLLKTEQNPCANNRID